jgi:hypothetical protein
MSGDRDIEQKLTDLALPGPRPALRDEIRRGLSPFTLVSPIPWAAAATLLVGLFVATEVRDSAHEHRVAGIRGAEAASEPALRWAAAVRHIRETGGTNG